MNTTPANIQHIQTRLQALGQTNRRVVPSHSLAPQTSTQPSILLPTAQAGDRPSPRQIAKPKADFYASPAARSHPVLSPPSSPLESRVSQPSIPFSPSPAQHQASSPSALHGSTAKSTANSSSDSIDAAFQMLDVQVQHVNSMSEALETALQEIATIAQHLNHQRIRAAAQGQPTRLDHLESPLVYDPQRIDPERSYLPHIDRNSRGEFVITGRPLIWGSPAQTTSLAARAVHPAQAANKPLSSQDSGAIATHLRHRTSAQQHQPSMHSQTWLDSIVRWFNPSHPSSSAFADAAPSETFAPGDTNSKRVTSHSASVTPTLPHPQRQNIQRRPSQRTASPFPFSGTIPVSLLLIGAAAIARVGMDWLLVIYPSLWPVVIALVVTPAAIAIYRSTVDPQSSFALGRRLLLVMVGLLIGGRL